MKLTDIECRQALPRVGADGKPAARKLPDGNGLYLLVTAGGSRLWRRDFQLAGVRGTASLGVYLPTGAGPRAKPVVGLAEARRAAEKHKESIAIGVDPRIAKKAAAEALKLKAEQDRQSRLQMREDERTRKAQALLAKAEAAKAGKTVREITEKWCDATEPDWTKVHAGNVRQSLRDHVDPYIGLRPAREVDGGEILEKVLRVLLAAGKVETATRVFQRLDAAYEWAQGNKFVIERPTQAIVREFKKATTQARKKNPKANFPCVSRHQLPQFLRSVSNYAGSDVVRLALRLQILCFPRPGELRQARWSEVDLEGAVWTIPPERLKVKLDSNDQRVEPHKIPLSRQAIACFKELQTLTGFGAGAGDDKKDRFVFAHERKRGTPISDNTCLFALYALGWKDKMTAHGCRALASTMLHEAGFLHDAIERQLAHAPTNETSAAYDRSRHWDARVRMLQEYADMLDEAEKEQTGVVVPISEARAA